MTTAKDVLILAASQIGTAENPLGSNNVLYNTWYYGHPVSGSSYPWCCVFVQWCFDKLGSSQLLKKRSAACRYVYRAMQSEGLEIPAQEAKRGDIVFFRWAGDLQVNHIGIVESKQGVNVITIEGNSDNKVMRRSRVTNGSYRLYFCRPEYSPEEKTIREVEETMLYEEDSKNYFFGNVWQDEKKYWLHVHNRGEERVAVTLAFWPQGKDNSEKITANTFWLEPGSSWSQDLINIVIGPEYNIKDNFALEGESTGVVHWSLREF